VAQVSLNFSRARPYFSGYTISHQIEVRMKTCHQRTDSQFCVIQGTYHRPREAKGVWGSCASNIPNFCLVSQFYSDGAQRDARHDYPPSRAPQYFSPPAEDPLFRLSPPTEVSDERKEEGCDQSVTRTRTEGGWRFEEVSVHVPRVGHGLWLLCVLCRWAPPTSNVTNRRSFQPAFRILIFSLLCVLLTVASVLATL
jgi:hypothetical protein